MAEPLQLVLWTKANCRACEQAQELMASLAAAMQFEWQHREGEYADAVPVVATADGQVLAQAPIAAGELVDAILAVGQSEEAPPSAG